mgnify:CR=1 FL=1
MDKKTIAIDFDGTIVTNAYPDIGKPLLFAFDTLKKIQNEGHTLILWTYRSGPKLEEAVAFCKKNGITFYAVNKSYPEEEISSNISRKINADVFIDDRTIGGMMGWGAIYHLLTQKNGPSIKSNLKKQKTKKGFLSRMEDMFKDLNDTDQ